MIRIKDAIKIEVNYAIMKFGDKIDLIDLEARNVFNTRLKSISMIKYIHGFYLYGKRDILINQQRAVNEYLRCNKTELWEYIVYWK